MTQPTAATNKAHAIWMLLPHGYANPERTVAKLSLVVSPRAITADGRLGSLLELANWPDQVKNLDKVSLFVAGRQGTIEARVTSPKPRSELWRTLFPPTTPVQLDGGGEVSDLDQVASSVAYGPVVSTLRGLYEQTTAARVASGDAGPRGVDPSGVDPGGAGSPLERALSGLAQWSLAPPTGAGRERAAFAKAVVPAAAASVQAQVADLLEPTTMTTATLARAAELLREQGLDDAAAMVPLVSVIRRLRSTVASDQNGSPGNTGAPPVDPERPQPGRLDHVRAVDQADFHQVLGLVSAQPTLALALGLCFDLELPALEKGEHSIRVTGGLPLLAIGGAPWSRVIADPQNGRFTMATQPNAPSEVRDGMLDLRPDGPGARKYVVTTMDVVGTTAQLAGMASAVAAGQPAPTTLPPRRNVGFTLAQVDRRSGVVSHTATRGKAISESFGQPQSVDRLATQATPAADALAGVGPGEMVLYADDVTAGYRVHVRDGDGPWRSLMRRVARYTIGRERSSPVLTADDEGIVDPIPLVEQRDARGASQLEVGETIFVWNNWSLVARQPGPTVTTEADGRVHTELVSPQVSANYPLRIDVAVKEGTLPRLRYGRRYQFRVFPVDLAGNSIDPALCDPAQVSAPVTYRRLDPLPAPELVLRAPLRAGEALDRIVVLSDGDGKPLGSCERHVAPPRAWFNLVELHGHFDAALGSGSGAAQARQRLLAIGANEAGSFTDLMVPDPADPTRKIAAQGLRLAVNEDAPHPPSGSLVGLVRGQALLAGEYPVHNTDALNLPYLADPLSTGIAIAGLPTPTGEVVTARYGGSGTWPDVQSLRLIATPGTGTGGFGVAGDTSAGHPTLTLTVPPAADVTVALSSTLTPAGLALMEIDLPANARKAALAGQEPLLTPAKTLRVVHAVRCPRLPLEMQSATADPTRPVGSTVVDLSGTVLCHPASTARVDIEASWTELVDDGSSEVRMEQRTAMIGSVPVAPGTSVVPWKVRHALGDGKRRDITCRVVASTRFREYFPADTPAEDMVRRAEAGLTTVALNTTRPSPPVIHSVLPTFRWKRTLVNGVFTSVRSTAGLRVWLERPWGETGTDERFGVLIYRDLVGGEWAKEAAKNNLHPLHSRMSGWWGDPLDGWTHTAAHLVPGHFPARIEVDKSLPPQELRPSANSATVHVGRDVLGHAVHYDRDRDLWFADIDIDITDSQKWFPFIRLAVVRHQPKSVPGCQISPVVLTDPVQLPPTRTLTATWAGPGGIQLNVTGQWMNNTRFEVVVHSRAENPQLGFSGAGSEISVGGVRHTLASVVAATTITATGTVPTTINNVPPEVPAARLVVQELQYGDYLHSSREAGRPVYIETVDEAQLRPRP